MTGLAEFLAPFDAATFRSDYFGQRPLHIRREEAVGTIFDWRRFNDALAITPYWTEHSLKLFYQNREALRDSYCDTGDVAAATAGRGAPAVPGKVQAMMGLGASLVANHIHRVAPSIGAVTRMLGQEFGARVFANVYCSFSGVQAFQTHFDLHDVFAFQAEGEKVWRIYEARADTPVNPVPPGEAAEKWLIATRGKVLFEAHMKPGDVLYVPRGQYHDALTMQSASLHVTFGMAPPNGLSLLKLLEKTLAGDRAFRSYLPDARSEEDLKSHLGALAERLKAVVASPAFAQDVRLHQQSLVQPDDAYALPATERPSWFTVVKPARVIRRDAGYSLAFEGREIRLGAAVPAIEWAMQQRSFSLEDTLARHPGVTRAEFTAALAALKRAGIVAETPIQ